MPTGYFEPLDPDVKSYEKQPMRIVPLNDDGTHDMTPLNGDFSTDYLAVKGNPRWLAKPTVAYIWARTVKCKNCRATIPLVKTRWLCKKDRKRVLLPLEPNQDKTAVVFGIETDVPVKGSNAAQRREHDKKLSKGTMSRAGADCPCCGIKAVMKIEDIRVEAQDPRIVPRNPAFFMLPQAQRMAQIIDGKRGKTGQNGGKHGKRGNQ